MEEETESKKSNGVDTDQVSTADESQKSETEAESDVAKLPANGDASLPSASSVPSSATAESAPSASSVTSASTASDEASATSAAATGVPSATAPVENGVSASGDEESTKGDAASSHSEETQDEAAREKLGVVEQINGLSKPAAVPSTSGVKTGKRKGFACRCGEKTCRRFLFSFRD